MDKAIIIAGFPGTGKSYFANRINAIFNQTKPVQDSDSSNFKGPDFPNNYISHIKQVRSNEKKGIVLVSTHKEVRGALVEEELPFSLVYPKMGLKEEYINRYVERGSSRVLIEVIEDNWDSWMLELRKQTGCKHYELGSNQYIYDVLPKILYYT